MEAAYRAEVAHLSDAAGELPAAHAPDVALELWMDRVVAYTLAKRGMKAALQSVIAGGSDLFVETRGEIIAAIDSLLSAGVAAGTLRADVTADDVWRAMGAVWSIDDPAQIRTLLRVLMDGLRHTA